ncbi:MAG: glycosyltransferase family 2 protein [Pseudomonadota bacterium]
MAKITLSIFIPTYNRARLLSYLLESIVRDLEQWPEDLEVVVSNNASTDNTQEIVARLMKRGFPIIYLINAINIGGDGNIASGFDLVSGKYMWVIGDDEIMYIGTVLYVLELCRTRNFGILHLANHGYSHGQQGTVCERKMPKNAKAALLDSKALFRSANIFLTFISANVVNRQAILANYPDFDAKTDLNTNLAQLAWTYSALKVRNNHYYVRTPLFGALGENTSGYKLIEVFGVNFTRITKKYLQHAIPGAERIIANAVITRLLPRQLMSQFGSSENKNRFLDEDLVAAANNCFQDKLLFKLFLKPMLSDSSLCRRIAFFCVRAFNTINRTLGYKFL